MQCRLARYSTSVAICSKMPWLTKDDSPSLVERAIFVPDDDDFWADFMGAFLELTDPLNWEEFGTKTPGLQLFRND